MLKKWLKNKKEVTLVAPITGKVIPLEQVEDPVFANKMAGDGLAIVPEQGVVVAPVDATVAHLFETKHAIGLQTKGGLEILIHIGLDTVNLKGEGFEAFVQLGDQVKQGQKLLGFDMEVIRNANYSTSTPVVITNGEVVAEQKVLAEGNVQAGEDKVLHILLK
ncbi:PTS sugar transporter subunit IIA [Thermoflavimicrobium dichotomicum]|uniref:PTS system, glucose-specific IIA component n=1 Tax=Thermoflavimicrobium dichotomicum TaxID=46223 RepID=A0A1I3P2P8_9BACL|nr:PTS glucose transporter subunit IIA [Thermoflavimicrobium dichotomicum]SFJ15607.1 PTS system, glucose-specific IIA component [Thermoflavimicrobium dichotomicum]